MKKNELKATVVSFYRTLLDGLSYEDRNLVLIQEERKLAKQEERRPREYYDLDSAKQPLTGFYAIWETGGRDGGNCWGGEAQSYVSDQKPQTLEALDEFLEKHFPNITFLQYKRLLRKTTEFEYTKSEYYGNHINYAGLFLSFDDLRDTMSEMGLFEE